jgi:hypothetical protein
VCRRVAVLGSWRNRVLQALRVGPHEPTPQRFLFVEEQVLGIPESNGVLLEGMIGECLAHFLRLPAVAVWLGRIGHHAQLVAIGESPEFK